MQIVEEAGGAVTCMDGGKFCVYDRSVLVSNGLLHSKVSSVAFFIECLITVAILVGCSCYLLLFICGLMDYQLQSWR